MQYLKFVGIFKHHRNNRPMKNLLIAISMLVAFAGCASHGPQCDSCGKPGCTKCDCGATSPDQCKCGKKGAKKAMMKKEAAPKTDVKK
jgi:hypothetical protein